MSWLSRSGLQRSSPPGPEYRGELRRIRRALQATGYGPGGLRALLADDTIEAYHDGLIQPALMRTSGGSPLETMARLFWLGVPVETPQLEALPEAKVDDWRVTNLVRISRGVATPLVAIQSLGYGDEEVFVASDSLRRLRSSPADSVSPVTGSARLLADLTPRISFGRALDLAAGGGVQAAIMARHCGQVVASDVNPRAIAFARANMVLNEVENVDLRTGDLFEPIGSDEFDLIVSNPPYAISPGVTSLSRDNALPLDELSAAVVRGAAQRLGPGGLALVCCDWIQRDGEEAAEPVRRWVAEVGCDVLVLLTAGRDAITYALSWLSEGAKGDPVEAERQFREWMDYYETHGIARVVSGVVVLRRGPGNRDSWFVTDELSEEARDSWPESLLTALRAQDWLNEHPTPESLLRSAFRRGAEMIGQPHQRRQGGAWVDDGMTFQAASGLSPTVRLSPSAAELVLAVDGSTPLGHLLNASLARQHVPLTTSNPNFMRTQADVDALVRLLVLRGLLEPVGA